MEIRQKLYSHYSFKRDVEMEIIETNVKNETFVKKIGYLGISPLIIHLRQIGFEYSFINDTRLPFIALINFIEGRYSIDGKFFDEHTPQQKRRFTEVEFQFHIFTSDISKEDLDFLNCISTCDF